MCVGWGGREDKDIPIANQFEGSSIKNECSRKHLRNYAVALAVTRFQLRALILSWYRSVQPLAVSLRPRVARAISAFDADSNRRTARVSRW